MGKTTILGLAFASLLAMTPGEAPPPAETLSLETFTDRIEQEMNRD